MMDYGNILVLYLRDYIIAFGLLGIDHRMLKYSDTYF